MNDKNLIEFIWPMVVIIFILSITGTICFSVHTNYNHHNKLIETGLVKTTVTRLYNIDSKGYPNLSSYEVYVKHEDLLALHIDNMQLQRDFLSIKPETEEK